MIFGIGRNHRDELTMSKPDCVLRSTTSPNLQAIRTPNVAESFPTHKLFWSGWKDYLIHSKNLGKYPFFLLVKNSLYFVSRGVRRNAHAQTRGILDRDTQSSP